MSGEDPSNTHTEETDSESDVEEEVNPYPVDDVPPCLRNPTPSSGAEILIDSRFETESHTEKQITGSDLPLGIVSDVALTSDHVSEYGITVDEGRFMRAVVKAVNRELEGYDLTLSMRCIRDKYEIDEGKLLELGYLKRHTGVARRIYYSVTPAGQDACRTKKKQGIAVGDIGADTPHRVGVELAKRYYESLDEVQFVEPTVRENGTVADLIVNGRDHSRYAIVEIEGGRITADEDGSNGSPGVNDYDSIRSDYWMMARSSGDSVWLVRNYEIAGCVLRALRSSDDIDFTVSIDLIKSVENKDVPIERLNTNHISPLQDDGISEIATFKQFRNRIS